MQTDNRSKFLSLLLRHKPEVKNLRLDKNGWCEIEDLLIKTDFTLEELKKIVSEDEKQRYSFKDDYSFIRANQGHSIAVDLKLKKVVPPVLLYHGTTKENLESILKSGLSKMNRNYVHLSNNLETATSVAMRRKKEIVMNCFEKLINCIHCHLEESS